MLYSSTTPQEDLRAISYVLPFRSGENMSFFLFLREKLAPSDVPILGWAPRLPSSSLLTGETWVCCLCSSYKSG